MTGYFFDQPKPSAVRLHLVRDEVLAVGGSDVESGDRLHEDQRRQQELLRGKAGVALASDGESSLSAGGFA